MSDSRAGHPAADSPAPGSDNMAPPVTTPQLTPQFCFSSGTLRDFLRLSRAGIDDSITQNLNALQAPSRNGFDPASISTRAPGLARRQIDSEACRSFKEKVLFPSWQARAEVLHYCGLVATSSDPDDPDAMLRKLEDAKAQERVVDERLDPYSARYFPREPRTERLALLLRQEKGVENIVRTRTWDVVTQRCNQPPETWQEAFDAWKSRTTA